MMQQMMGGAGANAAGTGDANANPMAALQGLFAQQGANGAANPLAGLFSGAGGQGANAAANPFAMFGQAPAAAQANVQPEILYRDQLRQLNDMGFTDAQPNIQALIATGGNVQAAIDRLLSGG